MSDSEHIQHRRAAEAILRRIEHLSELEVLALASGELIDAALEAWARDHLDGCATCSRQLAEARELLAAPAGVPSPADRARFRSALERHLERAKPVDTPIAPGAAAAEPASGDRRIPLILWDFSRLLRPQALPALEPARERGRGSRAPRFVGEKLESEGLRGVGLGAEYHVSAKWDEGEGVLSVRVRFKPGDRVPSERQLELRVIDTVTREVIATLPLDTDVLRAEAERIRVSDPSRLVLSLGERAFPS